MKNLFQKSITATAFVLVAVSGFSCAKKSSKIRGSAKTETTIMHAQTTTASIQTSQQQNLNYELTKIDYPTINDDGSVTMGSEVKTPQSEFLPFSTTHNGNQDAYGVYDDTKNGTKLDVRARCIKENDVDCAKYVLLVTVVKNGYAYHQMASISYANDCHFNLEHRNAQVVQIYKSLDEVLQQNQDVQAQNDCLPE